MVWNPPGSNQSPNNGSSGGRGNKPRSALDRLLATLGVGNGGNRSNGSGDFRGVDERWMRWLPIAIPVAFIVLSSTVLVTEQERGVVSRFGAYSRSLSPGIHFKLPWPIESAQTINATKIQSMSRTVPVLTNDENIVQVEVNVQYRVKDPKQYLFGTRSADEVLEQATLSTVREQVGHNTLDTVLGSRGAIAVLARSNLQKSLDAYRTGLVVTGLNLPNARPPDEVKPAFDDVNSAQQDKDRLVSLAQAYKAKVVPEARGEAAKLRTAAEGYRQSTIATAQGDAARFNELVPAYKGAPEATRKRMWLDTVAEVVSKNRVVLSGDSKPILYVPNAPSEPTAKTVQPDAAAVTAATEADATRPTRETRGGRD